MRRSKELRPLSFLLDYVSLLGLFALLAIVFFGTSPKERDWNPQDPLIQWPIHPSTVGDATAFVRTSFSNDLDSTTLGLINLASL